MIALKAAAAPLARTSDRQGRARGRQSITSSSAAGYSLTRAAAPMSNPTATSRAAEAGFSSGGTTTTKAATMNATASPSTWALCTNSNTAAGHSAYSATQRGSRRHLRRASISRPMTAVSVTRPATCHALSCPPSPPTSCTTVNQASATGG